MYTDLTCTYFKDHKNNTAFSVLYLLRCSILIHDLRTSDEQLVLRTFYLSLNHQSLKNTFFSNVLLPIIILLNMTSVFNISTILNNVCVVIYCYTY